MHCPSCAGTLRLLGVVCAATLLVVPSAFGQPLRATVVHIQGATDTWHVTDKDGQIVEVQVPSQSTIDIQTTQEERPRGQRPRGPAARNNSTCHGGGRGYAHQTREGADANNDEVVSTGTKLALACFTLMILLAVASI
jgi:hypothetical protein